MGQVCFASEENEQRIQELENLLKDQEQEKASLKHKLEEQQEMQRKHKKSKRDREDDASNEKIEQLTNEKKQVFKTMLKERKNVSRLEDQIQDYKNTISEMESRMQQLKEDKRKAQKRAEEAENKQKEKKKGFFGRGSSPNRCGSCRIMILVSINISWH